MLHRLKSYFNQPYPYNSEPRNYARVILLFTVFVGAFLAVFQPFGIGTLPGYQPIWISLGFAAVTFISGMVIMMITLLFPGYFNEDDWTLGREVLWGFINFAAVGHGNYLYVKSKWLMPYEIMEYGEMLFATVAVGFIPYFFMLSTDHMRKLRRNVNSASDLTAELHSDVPAANDQKNAFIRLEGENESDLLELDIATLLYIQSSANYIEVVQHDGKHVQKTLLRSTLASAEERLKSHTQIYRSHRTYLVNLDKVQKVTGNSQGYRLVLDGDVDSVPVARTKNAEFKEVVARLHPKAQKVN